MSRVSRVLVVLCLWLGAGAASCASSEAEGPWLDGGVAGGAGAAGGGGLDGAVLDVDVPDRGPPEAGPGLHPVCSLGCRLDDPAACSAAGAGGAGAEDAGDAAPPAPAEGCVLREGTDAGLQAQCEPVGLGRDGAPCLGPGDCAPGHGCVGEAGAAVCRAFCCAGTGSCAAGRTYCATLPLRDLQAGDAGLVAPVCIPADGCSLSEPWPCKPGTPCTCGAELACMVVRADGTTSCVAPGEGRQGDACPCAWGYVCSQASGKCLQLCPLGALPSSCGDGRCQTTGQLPDGWGVCIGSSPDAG